MGKDEMEHYLVCPYSLEASYKRMLLSWHPVSLDRSLSVSASTDDPVLLATVIYSVRSTVHRLRAKDYRAKPHEIGPFLSEQVRVACMHHSGLNNRIKFLWKDQPDHAM